MSLSFVENTCVVIRVFRTEAPPLLVVISYKDLWVIVCGLSFDLCRNLWESNLLANLHELTGHKLVNQGHTWASVFKSHCYQLCIGVYWGIILITPFPSLCSDLHSLSEIRIRQHTLDKPHLNNSTLSCRRMELVTSNKENGMYSPTGRCIWILIIMQVHQYRLYHCVHVKGSHCLQCHHLI